MPKLTEQQFKDRRWLCTRSKGTLALLKTMAEGGKLVSSSERAFAKQILPRFQTMIDTWDKGTQSIESSGNADREI